MNVLGQQIQPGLVILGVEKVSLVYEEPVRLKVTSIVEP